ncbi:MAG: rRNA maturation RNase YbeY [Methylomonas sp.]|nr:rRNA maturation RNase YbeY [Methylomonas sp.]PPD22397.1 MAG: rRNA maturation RNase YbeY [Methylomonas sp.]PPD25869.1 MAG: rRNA maturation RNase YbeY [Methylomonas sp.]PPD37317.1 MAG: rRNA maturation RNase YbeY [Methylomonas sp.]PPD42111.1 MAG: rRNA maturation RNase YbeY [Methylomonas sp.]
MNHIDLQIATMCDGLPALADFQRWVDAVLDAADDDTEIVIRLVDDDESHQLNQQYRHKSGPTNVLSFPFEVPEGIDVECALLGDLVICAPLIAEEARQQSKPLHHHWAHIVIHGVLHLVGYDHIDDAEADAMEAREIDILRTFNIADPYTEESTP